MNKIGTQLKFGWRLFVDRTVSVRMLTLLLLLGFVYHIFLSPLNSFLKSVQHPICPCIFPFLLSDIYFLILFMSAAVSYFSDVPFMKSWTIYQVIRTGRVRWALGQIEAIILSSFAFVILAVSMTGIVFLPDITLSEGWGKVLYTLAMTGISGEFDIPFSISYEIISRYTVWEALGVTILISGMVITFIGLLMFCVSLIGSRLWANMLAMLFVVIPMVQLNLGRAAAGLAYISPVSWMNLSQLDIRSAGVRGVGNTLSLGYCTAALGITCLLLSIVIIWKIRTADFQLVKED